MQKEKQLVPELRFPEFDGKWEKKKLGNISKFSKGKGISKSDISNEGINECIRYGELYTAYNELIDRVVSKTNIALSDSVISEKNDVIIPSSGETQLDIATASCVLKEGIILGGDLNIIKSKIDGIFLAYLLNNSKKKDIAKLAQGNSVVHLYNKNLASLSIQIPTSEEQEKIADFLTSVDTHIQTLEKKKAALELYKKGVTQKIFKQDIRFKDDDGKYSKKWDFIKLKEVFKRSTLKNTDEKIKFVLTNSATQGIVSQNHYFDKDIANQNNLQGYYVVDVDDFIYNPRISEFAPVGPLKRNKLAKGVMSPLYTVLKPIKGNLDFFEHYFQTTLWHKYMKSVANFGARHDRMNITISDFENLPVPYPSIEEQNKIAVFLSAISEQIVGITHQIEHTKTYKKGLLQHMFV